MRTRALPLLPLTISALLVSGCMAEPAPAPTPSSSSSSSAASLASSPAVAPSSASSSSTAAAEPVELEVQVSWIPDEPQSAEKVTGGVNVFVNGSAVDTHTGQTLPAADTGAAPLTLRPTVYPGDQVRVLVLPNPSRTPGMARCQIGTDTQTTPLDSKTGGAGADAVVQCTATVPAPPTP
ncbi:hypothetical protein AB0E52_09320 [Micrococcus luteus]|uniref:hypothetical protein n=1 Tax=Micrococcus luteus TaxID=1270 RepID=UPI003407F3F2